MIRKGQPGLGWAHGLANPFHEANAQLLLQLAHLKADGRLADAHAVGRSREGAEFDHIEKRLQLVEFHLPHIKFMLMKCINWQSFFYL